MYDAAEVKQHIARQELKKLQEVDQVRDAKLFDANELLVANPNNFFWRQPYRWSIFFFLVFHFHIITNSHFSASLNMPAAVFCTFCKFS